MSSSNNANQKGADSFADLMSFAGASSRSNLNSDSNLTMKERQEKLKAEQAQKQKASQQMWASGLDSLGSLSSFNTSSSAVNHSGTSTPSLQGLNPITPISASITPQPTMRSTPSSVSSSSQNQPFGSANPSSSSLSTPQTQQSQLNNSSLDFGFQLPQSVTPSSSHTNESNKSASNTPAEQNIDDIFDIFNKPPPPKPVEVKKPVPIQAAKQNLTNVPPSHTKQNTHQRQNREQNLYDENNEDSGFIHHDDDDGYSKPQNAHKYDDDNDDLRPKAKSFGTKKGTASEQRDAAIAELIDMGFSIEQANRALDHTADGVNVRQAVDFIMIEAHKKATGQPMDENMFRSGSRSSRGSSSTRSNRPETPEISKMAQDFSSQIFATGLSIFNQSKKTINKAIKDYTQSPVPNDGTPAWMRDAQRYKASSPSPDGLSRNDRQPKARPQNTWDDDAPEIDLSRLSTGGKSERSREQENNAEHSVTAEAMALESNRPPSHVAKKKSSSRLRPQQERSPPPMPSRSRQQERFRDLDDDVSGSSTPKIQDSRSSPKLGSNSNSSSARSSPQPSLSRAQQFKMKGGFTNDDDMGSYISPARRRQKDRQQRSSSRPSTPSNTTSSSQSRAPVSQIPTKPKAPPRAPVEISSAALDMATIARTSGTDCFKRGDYPQAEVFYTQALQSIPAKHLLRTIVLSNRAAVYMKLGDSKASLKDSLEGLEIVGSGMGADEFAEPGKPLKEIWSKLLTRKAEALEAAEKFKDSLEAWNMLIENGFSSKVALDGKRRCQSALEPKKPAPSKPSAAAASKPKPRPTAAKPSFDSAPSAASQEAVNKIRSANKKAETEDAERYQLLDTVEAQIEAWRKGKESNLRALLANLDSVLWPELGWKKIGMAELVIPKKVKIAYMKAVAKTHPDKVPNNATTQQKMVAQAVFVTVNKAWDGFKVENGLN